MKFGRSIRTKIIGGFLITIVLILILGVVSYLTAASEIKNSYKESTLETLQKTSDYYKLIFTIVEKNTLEISIDTTYSDYFYNEGKGNLATELMLYKEINEKLYARVVTSGILSNIYIFADGKRPFFTDGSFKAEDATAFATQEEGLKIDGADSVWMTTHPYIDSIEPNEYGISYGRHLLNSAFISCGYVVVDVALEGMHSPLDDLNFGKNSCASIIFPDGGELYTSWTSETENLTETTSEAKTYLYGTDFYNNAVAGEATEGFVSVEFNGSDYMFAYTKLDPGFMICLLIPSSVITEKVQTIFLITVLCLIAAIAISVLVGYLISSSINNAINKLMVGLEKASEGDLTVQIKMKRKDEFMILTKATNNMISNVKELINKSSGISTKVNESAELVSFNAVSLITSTKEITNSINEIEKGLIQQADDTQSCMNQMEALAEKITIVMDHSSKISSIADSTEKTVNGGITMVQELTSKATDTEKITEHIIGSIVELKTATNSISNIVNLINEIADQTNLLSLNASIEAARAGDAGRGFSVVADEIRKLAEQSSRSANNIKEFVNEITAKTDITVEYAKNSRTIVSSQLDSINQTVSLFDDINNQVSSLTYSLSNIINGIHDMEESKNDTIEAIQSITAISQMTAASSEEVTATVTQQLESLEEFKIQADELTVNSTSLTDSISKFKI